MSLTDIYRIVESKTATGLVRQVNERIQDGWVTTGGTQLTPDGKFIQAMVRQSLHPETVVHVKSEGWQYILAVVVGSLFGFLGSLVFV